MILLILLNSISYIADCKKYDSDRCIECKKDRSSNRGYGVDTDPNSTSYGQCIKCMDEKCYDCATDYQNCRGCIINSDNLAYGLDVKNSSHTYKKCIPCQSSYCEVCSTNAYKCYGCANIDTVFYIFY